MPIKSFSFPPEYIEEYNYIMQQPNRSRYICELVRANRLGLTGEVTLERVERLIDEKLKNIKITSPDSGVNESSEAMRESLLSMFGLDG